MTIETKLLYFIWRARMGEQNNAMQIHGDSETQRFYVDGLHLKDSVPIRWVEWCNRRHYPQCGWHRRN